MEKIGIFNNVQTSTSTSPLTFTLTMANANTGVASVGELIILGMNTATFNSYCRYSTFLLFGNNNGSDFSDGECLIYESNNISAPTITVDIEPIGGGNTRNNLKVVITPGNSASTKWNVYYNNLSFTI